MALWNVPGAGVIDDATQTLPEYGFLTLPDQSRIEWGVPGIEQVPWYDLPFQYSSDTGSRFQWQPGMARTGEAPTGMNIAPGYVSTLLQWADAAEAGQLKDYEREQFERMKAQALSVPTRDVSTLYGGWTARPDDPQSLNLLNVNSPDIGRFMLETRARMAQGTASPQERALFDETRRMAAEWDYRASAPQESDANPFGLGDQLFGALAVLGSGVTGGLAAGALAAGGAGLAGTLGSLGTLAGTAGGWAGTIGGATGQGWLQDLGKYLSAAGGLAGGIGGLTNLFSSGVTSLADAARLASGTGRILGAAGTAVDNPALRQAAGYLNTAGTLGRGVSGVGNLLSAAEVATQRGGAPMEFDYSWDYGGGTPYDNWSWDAGATANDPWTIYTPGAGGQSAWDAFTGWGAPSGPGSSGDTLFSGEGSGNWLSTLLGGAGGLGRLLAGGGGGTAGWLGPLVSGLGSLGTGLLGSQGASNASAAQAAALNRGIDLQTAQWLQTQANQAPWLQAGQQALPQLQQLASQGGPAPFQWRGGEDWSVYGLPGTTPGWSPQTYGGYTPVDVPSAANYRYTPGQAPSAAQYRYTPGAVPTLSGQELLANDPGVQFRLDEGRRALEASAAARGGLVSGPTLAALQRQGQELSSQEYANAWQRASQQAQLREGWAQTASQLGFGQAMDEARFREQAAQIASQQGWTQAEAEARLRAQQQQYGWEAGLKAQQWNVGQQQAFDQDLYNRQWQRDNEIYRRNWQANQTDYERALTAYNSQLQNQNTAWNRWASLANLGPVATQQLASSGQNYAQQAGNLYGQLGTAQGLGSLGSGLAWQNALSGGAGAFQNLLKGLSA